MFPFWKGARARLLIITAWTLSVIFSIPAVFVNSDQVIKGIPQCWIDMEPWQWKVYITLVATSLFFIPAIIIAACYTIIVTTIWKKGRSMNPAIPCPITHTSSKTNSIATTVFQRSSSGTTGTDSTGVSSSISRGTNDSNNHQQSQPQSSGQQSSAAEEFKRASSRGVIPRAKVKSVKMTLVIVFGEFPFRLWSINS